MSALNPAIGGALIVAAVFGFATLWVSWCIHPSQSQCSPPREDRS